MGKWIGTASAIGFLLISFGATIAWLLIQIDNCLEERSTEIQEKWDEHFNKTRRL